MNQMIRDLGFKYPDNPCEHVIELKKIRELSIDANYPFLNKSFGFKFVRALMHLGIFVLVFPLCIFRFGLRVEGRKNLKKHRNLFKNGAMTISNHIQMWDFLFVLRALRYRMMYFPAWKENLLGPDMGFVRFAGGIPVPEEIRTIKYFNQAFDEIVAKKIWIHAYPEVAMWPYYESIRPFKKGVFTMAYRYNLPVIPIAFRYENPILPLKLFNLFRKKKLPTVVVSIGEPIMPRTDLPRKEAVYLLRNQCHKAIVEQAGITDNPWPCEGD